MRKNKWFKMGAGLTAALMLCGSVSVVAFADEADAAAPAAEETVAEEVVTEEVAEEEVADIGDIVIEGVGDAADSDVAPEQEIKRISSEEEEVSLASSEWPSEDGGVVINDITVTHSGEDDPYYTVKVPYQFEGDAENANVTIFAYDVTTIFNDDAEAPEYDEASTPVGWVNQEVVPSGKTGTLTFKVAKKVDGGATLAADSNIASFDGDSIILIKVGGTGIKPAAKVFDFANATISEGFQGDYGNIDGNQDEEGNPIINMTDVTMMYRYYRGTLDLSEEQIEAANVDGNQDAEGNPLINMTDVTTVYRYYRGTISEFPVGN